MGEISNWRLEIQTGSWQCSSSITYISILACGCMAVNEYPPPLPQPSTNILLWKLLIGTQTTLQAMHDCLAVQLGGTPPRQTG